MRIKITFIMAALVTILLACTEKKAKDTTIASSETESKADAPNKVERGKYMVDVLGCADCHTPKKMSEHGPVNDIEKYMMGFETAAGLPPVPENVLLGPWVLFKGDLTAAVGPWGTSFAGNLTPHETGIGTWTLEQFTRALREAKFKGLESSRPIMPPMPRHYAYLTDEDIEAIFSYLKSIKPIENVVPAYIPPSS
ncbi:c-type cytochrome [Maribacter algicola]|uniref:C-type cytochrome n=1 Tax=Meishania litoralis TaxID=3434685 RepID=A0ACC7LGS9_9FLAO